MNLPIRFLVLLFTFVLFIMGCSREQEAAIEEHPVEPGNIVHLSGESIKQINLKTETVMLQQISAFLELPAQVITNQNNEARIGSLVQGRVRQVFVNMGDEVKSGQVLMTVEGLDVGQIKADFLKAKAALDYAKANYERRKILFEEKIGSQKELLESQAEYEKALAEQKAEDRKIHSVGLDDADITGESEEHTPGTLAIKSSINGIVVERNVVTGQFVDVSTNAFRVINTNSVWIDGQIYEKDLPKLKQKTSAAFTTAAYPNEKFHGKIMNIGQMFNEQTRTITIRGEFENSYNKLKPHMFGNLQIPVGTTDKAIMISDAAVVSEAAQDYVFVQTNDSTFVQVFVQVGSTDGNRVEIKDGLKENDRVVSNGVFYLKSELKKDELEGDDH